VKQRFVFVVVSMLLLASMLLSACQPAATAAPAPAATQPPAPAATAVPEATEAPAPAATTPPEPTATSAPVNPVAMAYTEAAYAPIKMAAPDCKYGGNFSSIEATDESTVVFTMCAPDPAFLGKIAVNAFGIYDKGYLDSIAGDAVKINDTPVGTGPYYVKEWVRGDHITFGVNPNYWGDKPTNDTFIMKWNKEAAARLLDLQSGNVDGIEDIGTDDYATVTGDANLKLYPRTLNSFLYLGFNVDTPPYDNEKVRQAFSMAIDRASIVKNFYPQGALPAVQFLPPGVKPGYTDGYTGAIYKYDKEAAKQMLTDAKFDFSKEYTLSYAERTRPYFPKPTAIAQAVQAQFADIGIKIKLDLQEWAAYLPNVRAGKAPLHFLGWGEDYPDATDWYDVFLTGSSQQFGKPFQDILDLIATGGRTGDVAVRQGAYDKLNQLLEQHVPLTTIAYGSTALAFGATVQNVVVGPYNENFPQMTKEGGQIVWSQSGEPVSLDCADETDGSSFRACNIIYDELYELAYGTATSKPALAESCTGNADLTVWTCTLKKGVKFSNGASFGADDVVASFARAFDAKDPNHKGNTGVFQYFKDFFGPAIINEPPK
jgi:peptide/nickel transport system substrate-binding protein